MAITKSGANTGGVSGGAVQTPVVNPPAYTGNIPSAPSEIPSAPPVAPETGGAPNAVPVIEAAQVAPQTPAQPASQPRKEEEERKEQPKQKQENRQAAGLDGAQQQTATPKTIQDVRAQVERSTVGGNLSQYTNPVGPEIPFNANALSSTNTPWTQEQLSQLKRERDLANPPITEDNDEATESAKNEAKLVVASESEDAGAVDEYSSLPAFEDPVPPYTKSEATFAPKALSAASDEKTRNSIKAKQASKFYRGYAVQDKLIQNRKLGIDEVGMNTEHLARILAQPRNNLLPMIKDHLDPSIAPTDPRYIKHVMEIINKTNIMVAVGKSPVNRNSSLQRRRLRIVYGRGVQLHPMAAKSFNADFDGDEGSISFSRKAIKYAKPAMGVMMDVGGELNLDVDFFPKPNFDFQQAHDYIFDEVLKDFPIEVKRYIFDALQNLGKYKSEAAFRNLIEALYKSARMIGTPDQSGGYSEDYLNSIVATLFNKIYAGSQHVVMLEVVLHDDVEVIDVSNLPKPINQYEQALQYLTQEIAQDMVAGRPPMNFQEFKDKFCAYAGEVGGKNVAFRYIANIAKMYRYDDRIRVGEDINFSELWEQTCQFAMSKLISNAAFRGSKAETASQIMKEIIIQNVGFPNSVNADGSLKYKNFNEFIAAFARVYQANANLMAIADIQATSDMKLSKGNNDIPKLIKPTKIKNPENENEFIERITIGSVVKPFLDIYGEFSMDTMFGMDFKFANELSNPNVKKHNRKPIPFWNVDGVNYITNKFSGRSLNYFKVNNDLIKNQEEAKEIKKRSLASPTLVEDIIYAIADSRTSSASYFHKEIFTNKDSVMNRVPEIIIEIRAAINSHDFNYAAESIDMLRLMGADLFYYYGMDNFDLFFQSKYGQELLKCKTGSEVGSVRIAMLAEMRLAKINAANSKYNEAVSTGDAYEVARAENEVFLEKDALASCSLYWRGIIRDLHSNNLAFRALQEPQDWMQKNASAYWMNPTHESVEEVLLDTSITLEEKESIVCDIIRYQLKNPYINSWEMAYQLEQDTAPVFSDMPPAPKSIMDVKRDFQGRFNGWRRKKIENAITDVENAYDTFHNKNGALTDYLNYISKDWNLISITDDLYADAIASSLDPDYGMSEKNSQHPWTNALFGALSLQRNGGLNHDIYRTDDRALGLLHYRNLSIKEVVKAIADPDFKVMLYDDAGNRCELSHKSLLGGYIENPNAKQASESEIWSFLRDNPRIAMALRPHQACVISEGKKAGSGFLGASKNLFDAMFEFDDVENILNNSRNDVIYQAKSILRDHPTFGAMVALFTPTEGTVSRNQRFRYIETENVLTNMLISCAYTYDITGISELPKVNAGFSGMISLREALLEATNENLPKDLAKDLTEEKINLINSIDANSANELATMVESKFNLYVKELAEKLVYFGTNFDDNPYFTMPDKASIQAFFSVRQDFNGAKTNVSTGVEGSETFELAPWLSLLTQEDRFGDLGEYEEQYLTSELSEKFNGMIAILPNGSSKIIQDNVREIIKEAQAMKDEKGNPLYGTFDVVVQIPNGVAPQDKTTDSFGQQVGSLNAYLVIKRDNGAEKYNLKIKKFGDDGTDSITKFDRYLENTDYNEILKGLQDIFDSIEDKDLALQLVKHSLAMRIKNANENLDGNGNIKYNELNLANYMCIADVMILRDGDTIYLRSLEALAKAIKYGIPYDVVENGTVKDMCTAAQLIANSVFMEELDPVSNVLEFVNRGLPTHTISTATSGIKKRSSSWSRNYELVKTITNKLNPEKDKIIVGASEIKEAERNVKNFIASDEYLSNYFEATGIEFNDKNDYYKVTAIVGGPCLFAPGPQNVLFVPSIASKKFDVLSDIRQAYKFGMTVVFDTADSIPEMFKKDIIPDSTNIFKGEEIVKPWSRAYRFQMLPTFDMRLNGSEAFPSETKFSVFQASSDRIVSSYEDRLNDFSLGDATTQLFHALIDRLHPIETKSVRIQMEKMFPNVFKKYPKAGISFRFANKPEIDRYVINGEPFAMDYGVTENTPGFEERKQRIDTLVQKYRNNYHLTDQNGLMSHKTCDQLDAGDIVGWIVAEINDMDGSTWKVLAPMIPFDLKDSSEVPTKYQFTNYTIDTTAKKNAQITGQSIKSDGVIRDSFIEIEATYNGGLDGQFCKTFEGAGAANKGMASVDQAVDGPVLKCGIPLDYCCAEPSTKSRRMGTDRRIKTMDTLMFTARRKGYNFGESKDAFPNNKDIAEELQNGVIPREKWEEIINDDEFVYHNNPQINAFVKMEVKKFYDNGGNPSHYLASHFNGVPNNVWWEFPAMYSNSLYYENGLLAFLNDMDMDLCPPSIDTEDGKTYDFRICHGEGFDYGCLQMQISHPHPEDPTKAMFTWENVYMGWSFFGEEFSGFHKPSLNGASMFLDALNAVNTSGQVLEDMDLRDLLKWSWADTPARRNVSFMADMSGYFNETNRVLPDSFGKTLALTGHRPGSLKDYGGYDFNINAPRWKAVAKELADYCRENEIDTIISGMALGFDQVGAQVAIENGIKLVAAIPMPGQENKWKQVDKNRYKYLLSHADHIEYISNEKAEDENDAARKLDERNHWMVDNGDMVYAFHNKKKGGTNNARKYAKAYDKPIEVLDPRDIVVVENIKPISKSISKDKMQHITRQNSENKPITSFRGEYAFLSNMYDAPVTVDWGTFRNAEAAFQAAKLMYLDEDHFPNTADEQRALYEPFFTASGKEARRLGRNIKGLDEKLWTNKSADRYINTERYLIMRMVISNKFRQNPELADKLIATGDAPLVEGNTWGDTYWGVSGGKGQNNLGKILQEVRAELKMKKGIL